MNQRQSSTHVKSWIFVWFFCNSEVQFSQHFIDFPINHDHSVGKKQGQRIFIKGIFYCFSRTAQTRLNVHNIKYPSVFGGGVFSPGKFLWVSLVLRFKFYIKWKDFVKRIICIIQIMRIKFPHISPPIILAYIIDNKALFISPFKLWVEIDSQFQNMKQYMEQCNKAKMQ